MLNKLGISDLTGKCVSHYEGTTDTEKTWLILYWRIPVMFLQFPNQFKTIS